MLIIRFDLKLESECNILKQKDKQTCIVYAKHVCDFSMHNTHVCMSFANRTCHLKNKSKLKIKLLAQSKCNTSFGTTTTPATLQNARLHMTAQSCI